MAGWEGAGGVPQCPAPIGVKGGNGEVQAGDKVGGAAPEGGAENGVEVEEVVTARQEASSEALEQVLQVCEQDMPATDDALSDIRGMGVLADKRKGGGELLISMWGTRCGSRTRWELKRAAVWLSR